MSTSRYEQAGVSIDAQDQAIHGIKGHVASTETNRVLSNLGSFGGLFDIKFPEMTHPVLVSSADGVGTKLKIAFMSDRNNTVGQCLVNHCINDILVQGAAPLFFMDYIATGKLKPHVVEEVIAGMATACRQSGLAILGGEMAEMPGFYNAGEYDVAGFIVGVVDKPKLLGAHRVRKGMKLIGLPSSGLHTNGYSLARQIIFEEQKMGLEDIVPGTNDKVVDALLAVHKPYYKTVETLLAEDKIAAMAHITGGGFLDNMPRVLPAELDAVIRADACPVPPLFQFLCDAGKVSKEEAYRVFNMGVGMILVVDEAHVEDVLARTLEAEGEARHMGEIVDGSGTVQMVW
ncbi:MAG: phosphoribosylformylglycinamidine cyclo-ligase [Acidobacteriota bacterium]|nr:phosphoribosylformylglycinamidine cyclo-ligase [Acidobacteriota bacterium]